MKRQTVGYVEKHATGKTSPRTVPRSREVRGTSIPLRFAETPSPLRASARARAIMRLFPVPEKTHSSAVPPGTKPGLPWDETACSAQARSSNRFITTPPSKNERPGTPGHEDI